MNFLKGSLLNRSKNGISYLKSGGLEKIIKIEAAHIQA
jgi:hypothetical protein